MKVWILGSTGRLGSAMVDACKARNLDHVVSVDVDITAKDDLQRFADTYRPTHVVNCAAYTDVDGAENEPDLAYAVNTLGPELLGQLGIKVVHISTDFVFNGDKDSPYSESDLPDPLSVYGKTKWEGEKRLLDALEGACVMRISWLFDHQNPSFMSKVCLALQGDRPLKVVTDQVGRPTFAADAANAALALLDQSGIWHFANKHAVSRFEWARLIREKVAPNGPLIERAVSSDFLTRAIRPCHSVLSTDKIEAFGVEIGSWKEHVF